VRAQEDACVRQAPHDVDEGALLCQSVAGDGAPVRTPCVMIRCIAARTRA
jgi:hypothetical protein